jgi:hypothetical protein
MYLFSPNCYQSTSIETLVAERNNYIAIWNEADKAWREYVSCMQRSDDGICIDVILCDHDGLSFHDHNAHLEGIENTQFATERHIETLGKKIEKLMRKQNRAKA